MSEDSYEYNDNSDASGDEENYDFEYSDDGGNDGSVDADVENQYYNAKGLKEDDIDGATKAFHGVVEREESDEKTPWGFKCLKQLIKIYHKKEGAQEQMLECYGNLLKYISEGAVTQNVSEKGINCILDRMSQSHNEDLLHKIYDKTLVAFSSSGEATNDRLWFKCSLKLSQLLLDTGNVARFESTIGSLLAASTSDAVIESATQQGAHLMEIYSLQIQMFSKTRDAKKLKDLYTKAVKLQNNVPHPRTLGIIQECGGKMFMQEGQYELAKDAFMISFKGFDEAGDTSRLRVLRYLLMASMLQASEINPLDSPEARPYKDAPEITVMTRLVSHFHDNDVKKFEGILRKNEGGIMDDEFIRQYMDDLLKTIRTQVLLSLLSPYTRVSLAFLATALNDISVDVVESLLVILILDGRLEGMIDEVEGVLRLEKESPGDARDAARHESLKKLASALKANTASVNKMFTGTSGGGGGMGDMRSMGGRVGRMGAGGGSSFAADFYDGGMGMMQQGGF